MIWENHVWGYRRFRLCGVHCLDRFMEVREALQAQKKLRLLARDTSAIQTLPR